MSGRGRSGLNGNGKPRRNPGAKGPNPHLKDMRRKEAEARALAHEAEGSPRSRQKRLAALKAA